MDLSFVTIAQKAGGGWGRWRVGDSCENEWDGRVLPWYCPHSAGELFLVYTIHIKMTGQSKLKHTAA